MKALSSESETPVHEKRILLCSGNLSSRFLGKAGVNREIRWAWMEKMFGKDQGLADDFTYE